MIPKEQQSVIIVAGGSGTRIGGNVPKQFLPIAGKPILMHTIEAFYQFNRLIKIVLVLPVNFIDFWKKLCEKYTFSIEHTIVSGGKTRFHSVKNGLEKVGDAEIVAIHDAARPFVSNEVIARCFSEVLDFQCGVIPVVDVKNSIRYVSGGTSKPLERSRLKSVQTPQVFPAHLIKKAYDADFQLKFTDDASVAQESGVVIQLIESDDRNFKITTSFDLLFAETMASLIFG